MLAHAASLGLGLLKAPLPIELLLHLPLHQRLAQLLDQPIGLSPDRPAPPRGLQVPLDREGKLAFASSPGTRCVARGDSPRGAHGHVVLAAVAADGVAAGGAPGGVASEPCGACGSARL